MSYSDEEIRELLDRVKKSNGVITPQSYFVQVPNSFVRNTELNIKEKMMYIYLWGFGGASMNVYPSQSRMVRELALSKPTVISTLKSLEEKGGIYIINRVYKNNNEKTTNLYYLAQIDTTSGSFIKKSIDIVKLLYPNKLITID